MPGKKMKQEHSFTLTAPLSDLEYVENLLAEVKSEFRKVRISRKTDRKDHCRFYLSFPYSGSRPDLEFQEWILPKQKESWDLYGPTYGRWGLS